MYYCSYVLLDDVFLACVQFFFVQHHRLTVSSSCLLYKLYVRMMVLATIGVVQCANSYTVNAQNLTNQVFEFFLRSGSRAQLSKCSLNPRRGIY